MISAAIRAWNFPSSLTSGSLISLSRDLWEQTSETPRLFALSMQGWRWAPTWSILSYVTFPTAGIFWYSADYSFNFGIRGPLTSYGI